MIDLTFTNDTKHKAYGAVFFKKIITTAVHEFKFHKDIGLSVNLVGKAKIQALNKKHRKKNKPTDVLSFPLTEKVNVPLRAISRNETKNVPRSGVELGDIFICPDVVSEKAKASSKTIKQEMAWVTVHGLLHLLGYDHERSKSEEKKMFALQDKILRSLLRTNS